MTVMEVAVQVQESSALPFSCQRYSHNQGSPGTVWLRAHSRPSIGEKAAEAALHEEFPVYSG
jgi:hypothetical protein